MVNSATFCIISTFFCTACVIAGVYVAASKLTPELRSRRTIEVTVLAILWLIFTALLGLSGFLGNFSGMPPRLILFLPLVLGTSTLFVFSRWGTLLRDGLSLSTLVAFHLFRVLPETLLFLAYKEGIAPVQMSFVGHNFDIYSALAAPVAAFLIKKGGNKFWARAVAWGWNVIGVCLLFGILTVAVLSTPTPFRMYDNEPANTFVATFPYVWLPGVLVFLAFGGHVLVVRKLLRQNNG